MVVLGGEGMRTPGRMAIASRSHLFLLVLQETLPEIEPGVKWLQLPSKGGLVPLPTLPYATPSSPLCKLWGPTRGEHPYFFFPSSPLG